MKKPDRDKAHHRPRLVGCIIIQLAAFHIVHQQTHQAQKAAF